jgi:glucose/mannose-6-phosphate isomerase
MNIIYNAIKKFESQFDFDPIINNENKLKDHSSFVVVGMGGSHLSADLVKLFYPEIDLTIHSNYDLPKKISKDALIILSSFSGNTEETISAFNDALKNNYSMAVISSGGKLIKLAEENNIPYIQLPHPEMQPRSALGFSFVSFLRILGVEKQDINFDEDVEKKGEDISSELVNKIPVIYASEKNKALAFIWKININETGKCPAFYNVFPELNHNEMISFENEKDLEKYCFLLLRDENDHPKIKLRMDILEKLFKEKGFSVISLDVENIWNSILLANFTAFYLAKNQGFEPGAVEFIEGFKKML